MSTRLIPGPYGRTLGRAYNGTTHYHTCASGLGLGSNEAKSFGGIFQVTNYTFQRVLMSIGVNGAGTSRIFLSTAATTGAIQCTTTDAGIGSSGASCAGVAAGTWMLAFGVAYEGNVGREAGCNNTARGTEGTTRATTVPPNTVKIGATPSSSVSFLGSCANAWVIRGVLSESQQAQLYLGAHISQVAPGQLIEAWDFIRVGPIRGMRGYTMDAIGAGGSLVLGPPHLQQAPRLVRVYVGLVASGSQDTDSTPAVATWTAPDATATPGAVTATSSPATAAWTAPAATATAGAVTVSATAAAASWAAPAATATPGTVTATASPATASWSAPAATATPGTATATSTAAAASWVAPDATATGAGQSVSSPAVTTWVAPAATAQAGAVTVDASPAVATWSAPDATASGGNTVTATASSLSWVAPAASATTTATVTAAPAVSVWSAPAGIATPGAVTSQSAAALATWVAPAATAIDGSIPVYTTILVAAARAGTATIAARAGRTSIAARSHLS
jgi:hypothetical protein